MNPKKTLAQTIKKHQKNAGRITLVLLAGCLITLLILPADYFDHGQAMCLSRVLANRECYACGMTRGIQHLLHLDIQTAWEFNKLVFVVMPLAIFLILKDLLPIALGKNSSEQ